MQICIFTRAAIDAFAGLPHGEWQNWLEREFLWSAPTAWRLMQVEEMFRLKSFTVKDLQIDVGSLYLLAAPSTPESARAEVLDLAAQGYVSREEVQRIVAEAALKAQEGQVEGHRVEMELQAQRIHKQYAGSLSKDQIQALVDKSNKEATKRAEKAEKQMEKIQARLDKLAETPTKENKKSARAEPFDLAGRDPADFKAATALIGLYNHFSRKILEMNVEAAFRGMTAREREDFTENTYQVETRHEHCMNAFRGLCRALEDKD
jgi:hypothetical protein